MQPVQSKENLSSKATVPGENDKIRLLSDLVDRATNVKDLMEYHKNRCLTYYEANRYKDCLCDIEVLEQYGYLDESLLLIKWICTIHCHIGEVRNTFLDSLNVDILNNRDTAIKLLACISDEKVNKLIQRTSNNRLTKKMKRLN
ncbi:unnamed protein product [Rotaria socialis]|nr:unnamed protein product [Rotaria socialis]CAF3375068.1 unnamed protein product [Rotaria socialis]CAF4587428.1 unnamed protein product [Rotaria socialis]CAF4671202.1 unnamed protein product [Rotaria socialis]